MNEIDENDLKYWFPILKNMGTKVPETLIIETELPLLRLPYGECVNGFDDFIKDLTRLCENIGLPCFLRTGHTSAKFAWDRSCFLERIEDLKSHVMEILEFSALADMLGLSVQTWAVREFLSLRSEFTAFFGNMPVAKERRYFIRDGRIVCHHPYWPRESIEESGNISITDWEKKLKALNYESSDEVQVLTMLSADVAVRFKGYWSLDWAQHQNGEWYAIDMALGHQSWHWDGCLYSPESQKETRTG